LLAHAKYVINSISDKDEEDRLHPATVSSSCGWYFLLRGIYEEMIEREHPSMLACISNFGNVLFSQGKYGEAEMIHRWAVEGSEKVLRRDHRHTLTSVSNLGLVLDSQGKYEEAEAMYRRALEGGTKPI
jgi:tetratricopeptide (TPR) repeat protein